MGCAVPVDRRLSRRGLLLAGCAALASTSLGGLAGLPAARAGNRVGGLRRSAFAAHVGEIFALTTTAGATVRARLVEVDDYGRGRVLSRARSDLSFVLVFHAPRSARRLEQDVMAVRHPDLGTVDLLVSPAGTGRHGQDYVAVIDTAIFPFA